MPDYTSETIPREVLFHYLENTNMYNAKGIEMLLDTYYHPDTSASQRKSFYKLITTIRPA